MPAPILVQPSALATDYVEEGHAIAFNPSRRREYITDHPRSMQQKGDSAYWPCVRRESDLTDFAILMREHAPGVAFVRLGKDEEIAGLTLVEPYGAPADQQEDGRVTDDTADLRLAIAYVCCGQLPPTALTLKALAQPLPWPVDDEILGALKRSVQHVEEKVATASANIVVGPGLKM